MSKEENFKSNEPIVSKKPEKLKKPSGTKKSDRFESLEQEALKVLGDNYWDWLEEKYVDLYIDKKFNE